MKPGHLQNIKICVLQATKPVVRTKYVQAPVTMIKINVLASVRYL